MEEFAIDIPADPTASLPDWINIAVEGCCHGELDTIYRILNQRELREGKKIHLLLICGDFESIRVHDDLLHMAVPAKYRKMNSFQDYFNGRKIAPFPTVFIGGNHEASNVLQSLYHGGYVAPNIYFLGFAGVINFAGIRIGGVSGIFNQQHYQKGRYEFPPYTEDTVRSIYHLRELEVYRMCQLQQHIDIFLSHDWPQGIWNYGDANGLLRCKPYFRDDMRSGKLGSPPLLKLLQQLKPTYWFAAHLHVKFQALYVHDTAQSAAPASSSSSSSSSSGDGVMETGACVNENSKRRAVAQTTEFMALDKVLPKREFLHVFSIPRDDSRPGSDQLAIQFDCEWLSILRKTHTLLHTCRQHVNMPSEPRIATPVEIAKVEALVRHEYGSLIIPGLVPPEPGTNVPLCVDLGPSNVQTDRLLQTLSLDHIWTRSTQPSASNARLPPPPPPSAHSLPSSFASPSINDHSERFEVAAAATTAPPAAAADDNEIDLDDM